MILKLLFTPSKKIKYYKNLFTRISPLEGYKDLFYLEGTTDTLKLKVKGWVPPPENKYQIDLPFSARISGPYFEGRMEGIDKSVLDLKNKVIEAYPESSINTKKGIKIDLSGKAVFSLKSDAMIEGHNYELKVIKNNTDQDFDWLNKAEVISRGYSIGSRLFLRYFYKDR